MKRYRVMLIGLCAATLLPLAGCDFSSPWGSSSNGTDYGATSVTGNTGGNGTGSGGTGTPASPKGGVGGESGTSGADDTVVATTFSCATVSAGTACELPLTYAPTAAGSGTLMIGYSYTNDAGFAKTGTVTIGYRAT